MQYFKYYILKHLYLKNNPLIVLFKSIILLDRLANN